MREKRPLVIVAGPTAVGKTALSVALAKKTEGSVISADSMQVYRHMDIGSAKATKEEMQGIPHYLLDVLEPAEEFNVARFQAMAKEAIADIYGKRRLPIVAGGTGFYIRALLYDTHFEEEESDKAVREELQAYADRYGAHALYERLLAVDAAACESIHENNVKRVIRALEFYRLTGTPISVHNRRERERESAYRFACFVLTDKRERLYERIDRRVDLMMEAGLLQEVEKLKAMGLTRENVSMQGLGYKELLDYLEGRASLESAVSTIKRDTRHFAKRQLTWFKRQPDVEWFDLSEYGYDREAVLARMLAVLREKGISNVTETV